MVQVEELKMKYPGAVAWQIGDGGRPYEERDINGKSLWLSFLGTIQLSTSF